MLRHRLLLAASVFFFLLLPNTAAALGCCVALLDGKTEANTQADVKSCFVMMNIGDCNTYKTNNGVATIWREKACSTLEICALHAPTNCCKSSIGDVVTKCIPSPDTSACNIFMQSAKAQILKEGSNPSGLRTRQTDGACTTQSDCRGKIYDESIYTNAGGASTLTEDPNFVPTLITPTLAVNIPGVNFSQLKVQDDGGEKYIDIPYIAQYIQGIYAYILGAAGILAIAMILWGGIKWVSAAGNSEMVSSAQKNISNALIGLVLTLASYLVLSTINPELVNLKSLHINFVKRITEDAWFQDHGTADPFASAGAASMAADAAFAESSYAAISSIPFDKKLGWAGNIKNYCNQKGAKQASTREEKIEFLVKAVLGWAKTCVQNGLCAYCQACATSPNGTITGNPAPNYAVQQFIDRQIPEGQPEYMWYPSETECIDAWYKRGAYANKGGPYVVNGMAQCNKPVQDVYQKFFIDKFEENKMFGGDCGSFARTVYSCAGASFDDTPKEAAYDRGGKKVDTVYLSKNSIGKFDSNPQMIIGGAYMDENLVELAEKKGGMKFGDLVYICCGGAKDAYSAHWFMYTGGRDDVPFSFIEMGGGSGVQVPGLGQVSGVHTRPKNWTIQDYINNAVRSGRYDAHKGLVYVWRPYAE
jgi:hypothetical protein